MQLHFSVNQNFIIKRYQSNLSIKVYKISTVSKSLVLRR